MAKFGAISWLVHSRVARTTGCTDYILIAVKGFSCRCFIAVRKLGCDSLFVYHFRDIFNQIDRPTVLLFQFKIIVQHRCNEPPLPVNFGFLRKLSLTVKGGSFSEKTKVDS